MVSMKFGARMLCATILIALIASVCVAPVRGETPSIPGFSLDEIDRRDAEILSLDISGIDSSSPAAFEDIPPDHWAYKAVQHLASIGLLDGYSGREFRGDQVITRYELAVIVSKMVANYGQYIKNGYIQQNVPVVREWPDAVEFPAPQMTYTPEPVPMSPTLPEMTPVKRITGRPRLISPIDAYPQQQYVPSVSPQQPETAPLPSSRAYRHDEIQLRSGPGSAGYTPPIYGVPTPINPGAIPKHAPLKVMPVVQKPVDTKTDKVKAPAQDSEKDSDKPEDKSKDSSKAKETDKSKDSAKGKDGAKTKTDDKGKEKSKLKIPKELKSVADKFELTEKDVAMFETLVKYTKDQMKEMEGKIKKDLGETKRLSKKNESDIDKLEQENLRFKVTGSASFRYSSTEVVRGTKNDTRTGVDNGASSGFGIYSKPRKFDDLVLTTNFSGGGTKINYQDFAQKKGNPRNFKLRSMYAGETSLAYSPLTTFGSSVTGINADISLNDYSIKFGMGRKDSVNYLYGMSLQTNLFNKPSSFMYISRLFSFQDKDFMNSKEGDGIWGCPRADEDWEDRMYPVGSWTSDETVCLPPEKNSVTSVFIQSPLTKVLEGLSIWAEYAHSTYYRQGFNMTMKNDNANASNYNNQFSSTEMYSTWRPIREKQDADEAFLLLFSYSKGPLSIFPIGYGHLGSQFVSRYLGLPGFDLSNMGLDLLPIKIQSLDVYVAMPSFNKTDDHYKIEGLYVTGGEHHPMYLDVSALYSQPDIINNFKIIDRLNNRNNELNLKLSYWNGKVTYYVSDDISISGSIGRIKAALGPGCVDANEMKAIDDFDQLVYYEFGNGSLRCDARDPLKEQEDINPLIRYAKKEHGVSFFWRTSNKAEYSLDFKKNEDVIALSFGAGAAVDDAFRELIPQGSYFTMNHSLRYRLTDLSNVTVWYNNKYRKPAEKLASELDVDDWYQDNQDTSTVGIRLEMSF